MGEGEDGGGRGWGRERMGEGEDGGGRGWGRERMGDGEDGGGRGWEEDGEEEMGRIKTSEKFGGCKGAIMKCAYFD